MGLNAFGRSSLLMLARSRHYYYATMPRKKAATTTAITIFVIAAIAAVIALVVVVKYRPLVLTGTGYAAHNVCALHYIAGRDDPGNDLPDNPLVPHLRTEIDEARRTATASARGLFPQTAYYSEDLGCTVAEERPQFDPPPDTAGDVAGTKSPGIALPPAQVPADISAEERTTVVAAVDAAMARDGTRAVVVVRGGSVVTERYADGFDSNTPQLGWSMTKSVASAMVGRAIESADREGNLHYGTKNLRPEWTDDREEISIDDLLRMTSGLQWNEEYDLGTPITQMLYREPDMAAFAAAQPLAHPPPEPVGDPPTTSRYRQYSSGSTNILCDVLQDRTGLGPNIASKLIFDPLGMTSAVLEADAAGTPVCSSYGWATPIDWAKFGQFYLQNGKVGNQQLLPDGWVEYSTTARPAEGEPEPYGASWWLNRDYDQSLRFPGLPADTYWASGHDGQYLVVVPSADLVVVRMGFSPGTSFEGAGMVELVKSLKN